MKRNEQLVEEIRERMKQLYTNGVSRSIINELLLPSIPLSRLRVTADCRIFLMDYNNIEIEMPPLPKAVFLLFLRHEEGIMFKHLSEHQAELTKIYERIANRSSKKLINESIKAITDPTNNSINEKCARIRQVFSEHIDSHTAENYCICGMRSELKRITLPRDLVQWEITI